MRIVIGFIAAESDQAANQVVSSFLQFSHNVSIISQEEAKIASDVVQLIEVPERYKDCNLAIIDVPYDSISEMRQDEEFFNNFKNQSNRLLSLLSKRMSVFSAFSDEHRVQFDDRELLVKAVKNENYELAAEIHKRMSSSRRRLTEFIENIVVEVE